MIRSVGQIIVWPNTSCLFRPFVACGFEVAGRGIVSDEPNRRIGRYLCRCNNSNVDGSRLARFYGGRFDSPSDERTERICKGQIASCVFRYPKLFP